jgi:hypothetical protein
MAADLRLSGAQPSWRSECDIRYNYANLSQVIAAANTSGNQAQLYSSDGGAIWAQTTLPSAPGGADVRQGDPSVDWTSDGTAWALTIGIGTVGNAVRCFKSTASATSPAGATWTFDSTVSGTQTNVDKPVLWVDHSSSSPHRDNMYALWWWNNRPNGHTYVSRRVGPGGIWGAPQKISAGETTGSSDGGDIKTNAFGDVYVFWPSVNERTLNVAKSTDGGVSYSAPVKIADTLSSFLYNIPASQGSRGVLLYISGGAWRTATEDIVYAAWMDLAGGDGCKSRTDEPGNNVDSACKTRIWFSRSTDGGAHWSVPLKLNDRPEKNDQFYPRLAVDETNGDLAVVYYDTINNPARLKTDIWMQSSTDNGQSWSDARLVTSAETDETSAGANSNQRGDYIGMTGFAGQFFGCWTDRRSGGFEEIWGAPILLPNRFPPMAPVAALHRTADFMDIFSVSESGEVTSAWWNGNPWRPWFRLFNQTFPLFSPIAAVSRNSNQMDLFVVQSGQIKSCWFTGEWNDWFPLPPSPTPLPDAPALDAWGLAALSRDPNFMDVFAVDVDGVVRSTWWNGNPWRAWFPMGEKRFPPGGPIRFPPGAPIAALSRNQNHMELFIAGAGIDNENQLWANFFDGNRWSGWFQPNPSSQILRPRTKIAAISRNRNQMDLFAISPQDNQIYNSWWNGSWNDWFKLPDLPSSTNPNSMSFPPFGYVAANTRDPNFMDVFAVDNNGDVRLIWWNGTWTTSNWVTLGGKKFPPGAPITVISRNSNQMDLFIVSDDHRIWSTWFTGSWSNIWFEVR